MPQPILHGSSFDAAVGRPFAVPQDSLQRAEPRWRQLLAMARQPSNTPRWLSWTTHGALILTILGAAVVFGRTAQRTEDAVAKVQQIPQLEANFGALSNKLDEVLRNQNAALEPVNRRIDAQQKQIEEQQKQTAALISLSEKVTALTGQMGSVWALEQANSNSVHELKGTLNTLVQQQQHPKE